MNLLQQSLNSRRYLIHSVSMTVQSIRIYGLWLIYTCVRNFLNTMSNSQNKASVHIESNQLLIYTLYSVVSFCWKIKYLYSSFIWFQLPLTRPKSPKLSISRRKSYSDATNASSQENGGVCPRAQRRSLGCKEGNASNTPKSKSQNRRRSSFGSDGSLNSKERMEQEKENTNAATSDIITVES